MADSDPPLAETADLIERRESQSPTNVEANAARRSQSPSRRRKRHLSKDQRRRRRRRRHDQSSSSSDSESEIDSDSSDDRSQDSASSDSASSDSSSADSSSQSEESDSEVEREKPSSSNASSSKDSTRQRFGIEADSQSKLDLPKDMNEYLLTKFNKFIPDKSLKEKILDKLPLPSASCIKAPALDDYVPDIFTATRSSYGKSYESNLQQIQERIGLVMGPLSRIWLDLDNIDSGRESGQNLDPSEWLDIIEKTITLLGQAFTTTTYHRRMNILYNLTKDVKKAKQLLKSNSEDLASSQKLFGKKFYKALAKSSKVRKRSKEISQQLGSTPKKRKRSDRDRFNGHKQGNQPFRSEAPSRGGRGGGRINFKRGSQKSQRGKCMSFTRITESCTTNQVKPSGSGNRTTIPSKSDVRTRAYSRCSKKSATHPVKRKISHRRKTAAFSEQLAVDNTRYLHPANCSGNGDPISGTSNTDKFSPPETRQKECPINRPGSTGNDSEGSNRGSFSLPRSISEPCFPSPKERWGSETGHKPKKAKSVCGIPTFQDGGNPGLEVSYKERGLHGQTGLERCLFQRRNCEITSEVSSFLLAREDIRIPSAPLWPRGRATLLHQATQTGRSLSPENRGAIDHLSGRHDIVEPVQTHATQGFVFTEMDSGEPRFLDKYQEIGVYPGSGNPVFGISNKFCRNDYPSSPRQDSEDHSKMPAPYLSEGNKREKNCGSIGLNDLIFASSCPSSPPLSSFTNDPDTSIAGQSVISGEGDLVPPMHTRTQMVGFADAELEREGHYLRGTGHDNNERCFQERLGRDLRPQACAGPLDCGGIQPPYQCTGAERSTVYFENLCPGYEKCSRPFEDGQQDRSSLYPENGGNPVSTHATGNPGNLGVCPRQGDNAVSRILTGLSEHRSRLAIQEFQGQQRLAVEEDPFPSTGQSLGSIPAGSVCEPPQYTAEKLCQLVPGSIRTDSGCLSETVERERSLPISPVRYDRTVSDEGQTREGLCSSGGTTLANSAMVPNFTIDVDRQPDPPPSLQGPFNVPVTGNASSVTTETVSPSGLENLRKRDIDRGVSKEAAELLAKHSWRKGTITAYNSCWGQWCSWCHGRQTDPFCTPVVDIVNYLTERFDKGDSYRTLNSHRSAISAFHEPIDGVKVGQHPLVRRLMTASFNAKPPQPRYTSQWNVDIVLEYITSLGPNDSLSDKLLTHKLTMLLALGSAGRTSELCAFDVRYMSDGGDSITFRLAKLTKSRKIGQPPLSITFDIFSKEPTLCVVRTARAYLSRSLPWRGRKNLERNQLLLSHVEPHKPVVSCTIAGWLVSLLKAAGIDTDQFKAHSTRGASTSKAKALGLSCREILKAARWSNMTTFKRHYLRQAPEVPARNKFQHTVLS